LKDPRADRWQALFQQSRQPMFVLDPQRRLVLVNRAWEEWTGRPATEVRGQVCRQYLDAKPGSLEALVGTLVPPSAVLTGEAGRVRRLVPAAGAPRQWCDIDFLPVQDADGLRAFLGKITPTGAPARPPNLSLPEEFAALREARAHAYRLEYLAGDRHGGSARLRQLVGQAHLAAQVRVPILILGEPGAGKEWLARAIHSQGPGRDSAFAAVDCAHLPPAALAPLLFGDGGLAWRPEVGTLYLREPARLPRDLQERILALAADPAAPGPRLAAGSCVTLAADRPRDDLHCTLGTLVLELPPLRDRPAADLPALVERLLGRAAEAEGRPAPSLTPEAWEILYTYPWPGNVRELGVVLTGALGRAGPSAEKKRIDAADLPLYLRLGAPPESGMARPLPLDQLLEQAERRLIILALRRAQGNKTRAAEILSVWRPRLLRRMQALHIADMEGGRRPTDADNPTPDDEET
jgi:transcriptional regulator with PAS, ATPase and Fis domain